MIKPVTMYSVVCDRCGKTFIDEFNGIVAWLDEGTAKEQAMQSEWAEIGDKHYCPDCYEFDDELDEYVPKKKGDNCLTPSGIKDISMKATEAKRKLCEIRSNLTDDEQKNAIWIAIRAIDTCTENGFIVED